MTTKNTSISLADLNINKRCETGYDFEYYDENDKPSGIFLTVIGGHADKIKKASFAAYDRKAKQEAYQKKRGKEVEITPLEEIAEENLEITAMRVIAWRGISEPCTPENVLLLLKSNALVVKQVVEESEQMANFSKAK